MRALVIALLLGNLGYFAWTQGAFGAFGWLPAQFTEREPQRIGNQLRPELLQSAPLGAAVPAGAPLAPASRPVPGASAKAAAR